MPIGAGQGGDIHGNGPVDTYIGQGAVSEPIAAGLPSRGSHPLFPSNVQHDPNLSALRAARLAEGWLPLSDVVAFFETVKRERLSDIRANYADIAAAGIDPNMVDDVLRSRFDVKPAQLEHEIGHQNPNPNRSITELVSNAVDASKAGDADVEVMAEDGRYVVEDFGKGMSAADVFEKLLIPNLSGKDGDTTIGRFGIGFFTALAHLNDENSRVVVDTKAEGSAGVRLEFVRLNGELGVRVAPSDKKGHGTRIEVQDARIRRDEMLSELRNNLGFVLTHQIRANGDIINSLDRAQIHDVGNGRLFISSEKSQSGKVVVTVGGVTIESLEVKGSSVPSLMVFDLPLSTKLPESRNRIRVNATVVEQIKAFIDYADQLADPSDRISFLNGIAPLIMELQGRNELIARDANLVDYAQQAFARHAVGKRLVPDDAFYDLVRGSDVSRSHDLYLPGDWTARFAQPSEWHGDARILLVDMPKDAASALVHDRDRHVVLLDRGLYEAHKKEPGLLSLLTSLPPGEIHGTWNRPSIAEAVSGIQGVRATVPGRIARDARIDALTRSHPALMGQRADLYRVLAQDPELIELLSELNDVVMPYRWLDRLLRRRWRISIGLEVDSNRWSWDEGEDRKLIPVWSGHRWRAIASDGSTLAAGEAQDAYHIRSCGKGAERIYVSKVDEFRSIVMDANGRLIAEGESIKVDGDGANRIIIVHPKEGPSRVLDVRGKTILEGVYNDAITVGHGEHQVIFVKKGPKPPSEAVIREMNRDWDPMSMGPSPAFGLRALELGWEAHFADGRVEEYSRIENKYHPYMVVSAFTKDGSVRAFGPDGELIKDADETTGLKISGSGADQVTVIGGTTRKAIAADGRVIVEGRDIRIGGEGIDRIFIVKGDDGHVRIFGIDGRPLIEGAFKSAELLGRCLFFYKDNGRAGFGLVFTGWSITSPYGSDFLHDGTPVRAVPSPVYGEDAIISDEKTLIYTRMNTYGSSDTHPRHVLDVRSLVSENARRNLRALVEAKLPPGLESVALQAIQFSPQAFDQSLRLVPHITEDLNGNAALMGSLYSLEGRLSPEVLGRLFDVGVAAGLGSSCTPQQAEKLAKIADHLGAEGLDRLRSSLWSNDELWRLTRLREWDRALAFEPIVRACIYYLLMDDEELLAQGETLIPRVEGEESFSLAELDAAVMSHRSEWRSFTGDSHTAAARIERATSGSDLEKSINRISHAMYHLGEARQHLYLRELMQNSLDAIRREGGDKAQISIESFEEHGQHVLRISDPVGMGISDVLGNLLIYGETTKGEGDLGKFGIGFFTIYPGAQEVRIRTGMGDGKTMTILLRPVVQGDSVVDIKASYELSNEPFKGTVIERVSAEANAPLEAAMIRSSVQSYGRFVDPNEIEISYNGRRVNQGITPLAQRNIPGLGTVRLFEASENAITVGSLYVKDLPADMISTLPSPIRAISEKHGIVVDLPQSTRLVRSRNEFLNPKAMDSLMRGALPSMLLDLYLARFAKGELEIAGLPQEYFRPLYELSWRPIPDWIEKDAARLSSGGFLTDVQRYMDERAFAQLLTLLPSVAIDGKKISLRELMMRVQRGENINTDELPPFIKERLKEREAGRRKSEEASAQLARVASEALGGTNRSETRFARTWPRNEAVRPGANAYDAVLEITSKLLARMGFEGAELGLSSDPKMVSAIAFTNISNRTPNIAFGLFNTETSAGWLAAMLASERYPEADFVIFMAEILNIATHEMTHHQLEQPQEWTHDSEFYRRQRTIVTRLMRNGPVGYESMWRDLKARYPEPTFLPAEDYLKMLISGKSGLGEIASQGTSRQDAPVQSFTSHYTQMEMGAYATYDPTAMDYAAEAPYAFPSEEIVMEFDATSLGANVLVASIPTAIH